MRARLGQSLVFALFLGLLQPRATDPSLAASTEAGRTALQATATTPTPAVGPVSLNSSQAFASATAGPPALPTPSPPSAQAPDATASKGDPIPEADRIRRELLYTDRVIAVLRAKVLRSANGEAQGLIADALKREREARTAYEQNLYARAARLTREARAIAREAAVMVGPLEEDPRYVGRTLDHAEDALELTAALLDQGADAAAWRRYTGLKNDLTGARQLFKDGAVRTAYARAVAVRDGVLGLLRDCEDLPVSADTASRAIRDAERAMEQAGRELGVKVSSGAQRWQREAVSQMVKARSAFARHEYRDAVIHAKLVERNLEQALAVQRVGSAHRNGSKTAA